MPPVAKPEEFLKVPVIYVSPADVAPRKLLVPSLSHFPSGRVYEAARQGQRFRSYLRCRGFESLPPHHRRETRVKYFFIHKVKF